MWFVPRETKFMDIKSTELGNRIRFVYQYVKSDISCCGVFIDVGSRDECNSNEGVAHLIEHMLFKGTLSRSYLDIIDSIENVGGDFNAYTSKEETCLYVNILNGYTGRAFDVLSDVVFKSVYPEQEIVKEKEIIIDEINSYKDSPSEYIFDEFEEMYFKDNSIAHNILGTEESVKSITRDDVLEFYDNNYVNENIIVSYVGGLPYDDIFNIVKKYFENRGKDINVSEIITRQSVSKYELFNSKYKKDVYQSHCMIGSRAYSVVHDLRLPTVLLNNVIGGNSFNSILNLKLREENGLTYNIESNYTSYSDTGLFSVYFGTDTSKIDHCIDIIKTEFYNITSNGFNPNKLTHAKNQLAGQLALSIESKTNLMISNAKSLLYFERIDTYDQIVEKIHNITNDQIIEVANYILDFDNISILKYY